MALFQQLPQCFDSLHQEKDNDVITNGALVYAYDYTGQVDRMQSSNGTITRTAHDPDGLISSVWSNAGGR